MSKMRELSDSNEIFSAYSIMNSWIDYFQSVISGKKWSNIQWEHTYRKQLNKTQKINFLRVGAFII